MTAANNAWTGLMKASFGLVSTSLQVSEMMLASSNVIGACITIMRQASRRPAEGDYAEITGVVAEKVVAVSKVNQAPSTNGRRCCSTPQSRRSILASMRSADVL